MLVFFRVDGLPGRTVDDARVVPRISPENHPCFQAQLVGDAGASALGSVTLEKYPSNARAVPETPFFQRILLPTTGQIVPFTASCVSSRFG